jgi:hypothetical protein
MLEQACGSAYGFAGSTGFRDVPSAVDVESMPLADFASTPCCRVVGGSAGTGVIRTSSPSCPDRDSETLRAKPPGGAGKRMSIMNLRLNLSA